MLICVVNIMLNLEKKKIDVISQTTKFFTFDPQENFGSIYDVCYRSLFVVCSEARYRKLTL